MRSKMLTAVSACSRIAVLPAHVPLAPADSPQFAGRGQSERVANPNRVSA